MVSQSQIWDASGKAVSGLEGLLEIVGIEVVAEGVGAGTHSETWR